MGSILVVDDEPDIRVLVKSMLTRAGHVADVATDGRDALRILAGASYDLLIVDMAMPDMDGMETIKQVRRRSAKLPILAMTGSGSGSGGHSTARILDAANATGATAHLAKPFRRDEFLAVVASLLP